jgi:flagellar basal body-associated protein FliL
MAKKKKPDTDAEAPKKGKKKIVKVLVVLIVLGVGGFAYKTMTKKPVVVAAVPGQPTTTAGGPITDEQSLTVNLRDNHYLEFTAGIQVAMGKSPTILATDQAIVLDILNTQAEAMTETELLKASGPAILKANLIRSLNRQWPGLVIAIYFEQFTMQ